MNRFKLFLPLIIVFALGLVFYNILTRENYDPNILPSALLNKPVPEFALETVEDSGKIITEQDLLGQVALLNVWATWCPTCRYEHPHLMTIAHQYNLPIIGIDYKDDDAKAKEWLRTLGNPYAYTIADREGSLGLDLGVYGAPETYIIDKKGIIRYKLVGEVNATVWQQKLKPVVDQLQQETH